MVQFNSPGIKVREEEAKIRNITGVGTSAAAAVVLSQKGPLNVPVPIVSFEEYINTFGRSVVNTKSYWAVKGFFDNAGEGALIWCVRTCHYTDITDRATATATLADVTLVDGSGEDTLTVSAANEGTWGNTLQISTELASRFSTTLNNGGTLANGALSAVMTSAFGMNPGKVLTIDDTTNDVTVIVDRIENNRVYFTEAVSGLAAPIADGASVVEQSFNLLVYQSDVLVESFPNVNMSPTDEVDYVEKRVNEGSAASQFIAVEDESSVTDPPGNRPAAVTKVFLTGGTDGLGSIAASDFVGSPASDTGLYALDAVEVINMVAIPESQTQVAQSGLIQYCELRRYPLGIMSSPVGLSVPAAITYFNTTLAANTSRAAAFYPQVKVLDPVTQRQLVVPVDGHVMGIYARTDGQYGVQQVGAGEYGQIFGILDFENEETKFEAKRDLLYQAKINPICNYTGLGRVVFGSRTLSKTGGIGSQINERRVFSFIEQSLDLGMRFVLFKLNTPEFRKTVKDTMDAFLIGQRLDGVLESFYTDLGEGLNNAIVRAQGKLIAVVGLKAPDTIEFFEIVVTKDTRALEAALAALV